MDSTRLARIGTFIASARLSIWSGVSRRRGRSPCVPGPLAGRAQGPQVAHAGTGCGAGSTFFYGRWVSHRSLSPFMSDVKWDATRPPYSRGRPYQDAGPGRTPSEGRGAGGRRGVTRAICASLSPPGHHSPPLCAFRDARL